jgi:hypothetical protein
MKMPFLITYILLTTFVAHLFSNAIQYGLPGKTHKSRDLLTLWKKRNSFETPTNYQNDLAMRNIMRNTADVTGGKPITI